MDELTEKMAWPCFIYQGKEHEIKLKIKPVRQVSVKRWWFRMAELAGKRADTFPGFQGSRWSRPGSFGAALVSAAVWLIWKYHLRKR